jgi:predicted nucleic acid-binding protein
MVCTTVNRQPMLSLVNQYVVTLDACVLLPMPLCDTLLRLAEEPAFYVPCWSQETLDEVHRNLIKKWRYTVEQADRRIRAMRAAFEEAEVTGYESLIPGMTNDPGDRHVLAAAVRVGADAIVSDNVKHFPPEALAPYGIELLTADQFLVSQLHLDADGVIAKLEAQAKKRRSTITDLLRLLGTRGAPQFAQLVSDNEEC